MAYNHNNSTMVKNIHGTSDERYKIGNLHKKFMSAGGTDSMWCQVKGCCNEGGATAVPRMSSRLTGARRMIGGCAGSVPSTTTLTTKSLMRFARMPS